MRKEQLTQPIRIEGMGVTTTNEREGGPEGRIPGLWQSFMQSGAMSRAASSAYLYAVYCDYESDVNGAYTLRIGSETPNRAGQDGKEAGEAPEAGTGAETGEGIGLGTGAGTGERIGLGSGAENGYSVIPAGTYLVFKSRKGPVFEVVAEVWREIWAFFADTELIRTYEADFERYTMEGFRPEAAEVEVYIGIR